MPSLNARQQKFVLEYQVDQVATQAAIRAGYSAGTAHVQGSRLLSNAKVREAIATAQAKAAAKVEVTVERVLKEYARIAFADIAQAYDEGGNLLPVLKMPEDIRRALSGIEITEIFGKEGVIGQSKKVRFAQKVSALDSLAKHLGMFASESAGSGSGLSIVLELGGPT
ncbi:terminase small subunit [Candidatus Binatus sp.]|uniref:terminase small subunit n=1 Tax=Candidatus Binatus sp. TaxID=2811406 RepID=UPI003CB98702